MIAHALIIVALALGIDAAHRGNIQRGLDKHESRTAQLKDYCEGRGSVDLVECVAETEADLKAGDEATLDDVKAFAPDFQLEN